MKKCVLQASFIALLLLSLSGCMATKPFTPLKVSKSDAVVYVYRPESLIYRGTPYLVYVNGKKRGTIINAAYLPLRVKPGKNYISLRENTLFHALVYKKSYFFEPGKVYYIRVKSGLYGAFSLVPVSNKVGKKEIAKTKYYVDSQSL